MEAESIQFADVDEALKVPETELRLFGKPVSYTTRRMGVALARGVNTEEARERARLAAKYVKPVT